MVLLRHIQYLYQEAASFQIGLNFPPLPSGFAQAQPKQHLLVEKHSARLRMEFPEQVLMWIETPLFPVLPDGQPWEHQG